MYICCNVWIWLHVCVLNYWFKFNLFIILKLIAWNNIPQSLDQNSCYLQEVRDVYWFLNGGNEGNWVFTFISLKAIIDWLECIVIYVVGCRPLCYHLYSEPWTSKNNGHSVYVRYHLKCNNSFTKYRFIN